MNYQRPKDLLGSTQKLELGGKNIYITVNYDDQGPIEVFCSIGKAGNNQQGESAAICQLVSRIIQRSSDRDSVVDSLAMMLRGIEGQGGAFNRGVFIKSVPDAIGWALQGCPDRDGTKIEQTKQNGD